MTTWAEARNAIRTDLWRPGEQGIPTPVVDRYLHAALRQIEGEGPWGFQVVTSSVVPDAAQFISPAGNNSAIKSVVAISPSSARHDLLSLSTVDRVKDLAATSSGGIPVLYAVAAGQMYLDTVPTTGTTIEIIHEFATPRTVADALLDQENATLAHENLLATTLASALIAGTFLKDRDEADRFMAAYEVLLDALRNREAMATSDDYGRRVHPSLTAWGQDASGIEPWGY